MQNSVVIIGASIADVIGMPNEPLKKGDSTPGKVLVSPGGVARNIAENIKRLGENVTLISAFGNDLFGKNIMFHSREIDIDIKHSIINNEKATSFYLLITNDSGNLELAISDTSIIEEISHHYIKIKSSLIREHKLIVVDTNLPTDTLHFITENFQNQPIFIDLVSASKAKKVIDIIGKFHTIKPNIIEAEILSGIKYEKESDLLKMRDFFLNKGVKQLFISMNSKGSFFANSETYGRVSGSEINPINSSGAGDAYMSGLIYCFLNKKLIEETACFAASCSLVALFHEKAVNPEISVNLVTETINKYSIKNYKLI